MEQKICFKVFGDICVLADGVWKPVADFSESRVGKKQLAFLIYMIMNHGRKVSSKELIECFWSDGSKDPANSLKNMMHKVRSLLHCVFPESGDLLITSPGGYEWNPNIVLEVDADLFEAYYQEAKALSVEDAVPLEQKAFELYSGEILSDDSTEWLTHRNTYYRMIFIDICKALAMQMLENEKWNETLHICEKAYSLAPEFEEFTICSMQALIHLGMPSQAIKHYESYSAMLWENFSLQPSSAAEQAHSLAVHAMYDREDTIEKIVGELSTLTEERKAFICSQPVFRNIVQLELRQMLRNGQKSSLVVLKVESQDGSMPSFTDIRRLERILLDGLRAGDPFSRLNQGTFIMLLPSASCENAHKVAYRIKDAFYDAYPRSNVALRHRVFPLSVHQDVRNVGYTSET